MILNRHISHKFNDYVENKINDSGGTADYFRRMADEHREEIVNRPDYVDRAELFSAMLNNNDAFTHETTSDITGCFVDSL